MSDSTIFTTQITVLVNHLNYANHLGYDSVLSILQEARLRWLKSLDENFSEINIEDNIGWLVREVHLSYESEAHHGDQLNIELSVTKCNKTSFVFEYIATNLSAKKVLCQATTTQVCFDFNKSKISRIPEVLISSFKDSISCNDLT